ncbi:transcription factor Dp isoform 6-T9 [Glossina fuscipes fuscipes]
MTTTNQPQFVRIQNSYNLQSANNPTTYTVITPQSSTGNSNVNVNSNMQRQHNGGTTVKYEPLEGYSSGRQHTNVDKTGDRYIIKPQQQNLSNTKITAKSKLHSISHQNASAVQRKRKPEKAGKGLRHFSLKVCEKVKVKGTTTYNEVADELVAEEIQNNSFDSSNCDQKNIRRRVYDALNVLMALQIISKDKKEIRWIGLPSNTVEQCSLMEKENEERRERIKQKHQQLRELLLQLVSFKSLIERNKEAERQGIIPTPNSSIQLPFIIVNTHKSTKINCSVTNDKSEYIFKFDDKFEMHDDAEVLKRMGLLFGLDKGQCSYEDIERAKTLVPPNFEKYVEAYGNGRATGDITYDSDDEMPSYEFLELTNDSSQHGFLNANNSTITSSSSAKVGNLSNANINAPHCSGGSGGGGVNNNNNSGHRHAVGIKTCDLDDDEEFVENSDID